MKLASIEYPEDFNFDDSKVKLELTSTGNFLYRPDEGENWTVKASLQRRNLLAIRVNETDGTAEILGEMDKHHAFRELFDFIPEEGTGVTHFDIDNFDQVLARLTGEIGEDVNSIVLPPILSFSHANLPFEARDLRTSIKTSTSLSASRQTERSWNVSFFDDEIPSAPTADALSRAKNVPVAHIDRVRQLFAERPIMSRAFLESRLTGNDSVIVPNLKFILPSIAYHWKNGPWHLLWTLYGLDPRSSADYKQ